MCKERFLISWRFRGNLLLRLLKKLLEKTSLSSLDIVQLSSEAWDQMQYLLATNLKMKLTKRTHREAELEPLDRVNPEAIWTSHNEAPFWKLREKGLSVTFS